MSKQHDFLTFWKKFVHVYEAFCASACKKHQMNQSSYDLILFLSNNPTLNTAKDVCEIRGVKKGIVSVTIDRLVSEGYLLRENDPEIGVSKDFFSQKNVIRLSQTDVSCKSSTLQRSRRSLRGGTRSV